MTDHHMFFKLYCDWSIREFWGHNWLRFL